MTSLTMTAEQTSIYDGDDEQAARQMMTELRKQAAEAAKETGRTVEIYTADGIVAEAVEAR